MHIRTILVHTFYITYVDYILCLPGVHYILFYIICYLSIFLLRFCFKFIVLGMDTGKIIILDVDGNKLPGRDIDAVSIVYSFNVHIHTHACPQTH